MFENEVDPLAGGEVETAPEPLTMEAAVSKLNELDSVEAGQVDAPEVKEAVEPEKSEEDYLPEVVDEAAETPKDETQAPVVEFDKLTADMKVRLRDGTEYSGADIKRDLDALRNVRKLQDELKAEQAQFQERSAKVTQHEQVFSQLGPHAYKILVDNLPEVPPFPDQKLAQEDFYSYQEQMAAHLNGKHLREQKIAEINQFQQASKLQQEAAQKQAEVEQLKFAEQQRDELLRKIPDLRDPVKAAKFRDDFVAAGKSYGFNDDELMVYDHRVILMARDAMAYKKLKANPPKPVVPAKTASAPVVGGGSRETPGAGAAADFESLRSRANAAARKGDMTLAAKLLTQLQE